MNEAEKATSGIKVVVGDETIVLPREPIKEVHFVAYRPGWMEKLLLTLIICQVIVGSIMLFGGSLPVRDTTNEIREIHEGLCEVGVIEEGLCE